MNRVRAHFGASLRRGFTIIELLVVVTLLLVVLGIAVPAFRSMLDGSERSLAENTLRVGVAIARDVATRGEGDAAIVFFRDSDGRTRLVPVVAVGTYDDSTFNPVPFGPAAMVPGSPYVVRRDVFAPIPLASPLLLPRGFTVAGYADPNTIDQCFRNCRESRALDREGWYNSQAYGDAGSAAGTVAKQDGNWLLPETSLFEPGVQAPGLPESLIRGANVGRTPRQTFMIRFASGTGAMVRGTSPSLVLDPRPSSLGRGLFTGQARWMRANRVEDPRAWTSRVLTTEDLNGNGLVDQEDLYFRALAIGNYSNDTVLTGPVARVALFRDDELVKGLGASGLNRETNSLYRPIVEEQGDGPQMFGAQGSIRFDMGLFEGNDVIRNPDDVRIGINRWVQGDTNFIAAGGFNRSDTDGDGNIYGDAAAGDLPPDEPRAKIFFVQPGTGDLTEVSR